MKLCRGTSLLEVSVTITITTTLLYGSALLFASFQRIDRAARQRVEGGRELMRLAEQFKSDVYAAKGVERNGNVEGPAVAAALLRLEMGSNRRIEYKAAEDGQLIRTVSVGEQISERDSYGPGTDMVFSIDAGPSAGEFVTLVLDKSNAAGESAQATAPRMQRRITALVGRDRKYAIVSEPEEMP